MQLFHWEQNSGKTEMVFRHDAHHLCTSSCSFLPAGQSAPCPLTPELHSCFSLQSFPSLFCALAPGKLSSCSWCGEGKDRAVGGVSERTGLQRPHAGDRSPCHISAMSPLLCIAKSAIAESRKHLVSLRCSPAPRVSLAFFLDRRIPSSLPQGCAASHFTAD